MTTNLERLRRTFDRELLKGIDPQRGSLEAAIHYALSVGGKRVRPLLFLTLLEAHGITSAPYLGVACALEMIHTYSLIHDDLPAMDDDDWRRGWPTVHKKFNEAVALLAGDTLLTYAFERLVLTRLPPRQAVAIIAIITRSIGKDGMAGGQTLDLEFHGEAEAVERIHRMKTAELIKGTFLAAAEIIHMNARRKRMLAEAGVEIGIAFQLADDLLDIVGDEKEVGKKLRKDMLNRSPNAALIFGSKPVRTEMAARYRRALAIFKELGITYPPFLRLIRGMVVRSK